MFTGIVDGLREVVSVADEGASRRITVDLGASAEGVRIGDSIAVDGCCLTVEALSGRGARFCVIAETLGLTTLGALRTGDRVNVERSLRAGDPIGGHFVSGHVDGVAVVVARAESAGETRLTVELPAGWADPVVRKGSIALDGVSLTVAEVAGRRVTVALIPHTLATTTLGFRTVGARVHAEADVIGKYVGAAVARMRGGA